MKIPVMLLPDQHYGHTHNRRSLRGTLLAQYGASFSDLGLGGDPPDNDLEGTLAIAEVAAAIDRDQELFDQFVRYMNGRLDAFLAMTADERRDYVGQLERLFTGTSIVDVVAGLQREMLRATADRQS